MADRSEQLADGGARHRDAVDHVRGRTAYVDDVAPPLGMLHAAVVPSPVAHGRLLGVERTTALAMPGVVAVLVAADVPGENQIGPVIADEPLLAEAFVHFHGQPVALVCAETWEQARAAAHAVEVRVEELEAIVDPKVAYERGEVIDKPRQVEIGDVDAAWARCALVLEGVCEIGGQEHVYLETQRGRAWLEEDGGQTCVRILSSTQGPYAVQKAAANVLGLPLHRVAVEVRRLGGGFGGKEDQASPWSALAALGAWKLRRPVELVLSRADDLLMTGKRHPYHSEWKIGVDAEAKILAFDVRHYQNAGAACDLSLGVLGRTLVHGTGSYAVPNARIWGASCRTHLVPFTAFRGFGGPQGMFVIESAVAAVAEALDLPRETVQERNLLREGDVLPYGQKLEDCAARATFERLVDRFDLADVRRRVAAHNGTHFHVKKGYALMPVCFGISFGATFLNQAGALLHIYTDGSVSVSTGGVEMGQGLTTNLAIVAAQALGIGLERVRVETTETRRIANMSASAASATTLLNGNAVQGAARQVLAGLLAFVAGRLGVDAGRVAIKDEVAHLDGEPTEWTWPKLVLAAYRDRVALSAHHFFATPGVHFDPDRQQGHPFAYHVYGTSLVEVTVDCLRGRYRIDAVKIVHDLGRPLARQVDLGQIEGALAQGLGWMTLEDLRFDQRGRLLSKALASYKVPDADFLPADLEVEFIEDRPSKAGPLGSKAVGEPPLMYGIAVFFALRHAMRAFRPDLQLPFESPLTPERVLLQTHAGIGPAEAGTATRPVEERVAVGGGSD
jgi:xanthine dehydrogenase large subunit